MCFAVNLSEEIQERKERRSHGYPPPLRNGPGWLRVYFLSAHPFVLYGHRPESK